MFVLLKLEQWDNEQKERLEWGRTRGEEQAKASQLTERIDDALGFEVRGEDKSLQMVMG